MRSGSFSYVQHPLLLGMNLFLEFAKAMAIPVDVIADGTWTEVTLLSPVLPDITESYMYLSHRRLLFHLIVCAVFVNIILQSCKSYTSTLNSDLN